MNRLTRDLSLQDPSLDALSPEQPFDELLGIGLGEDFADVVARRASLRSRRLSQSMNLRNHNSSIKSDHSRCSCALRPWTCSSIMRRSDSGLNKPRPSALSESKV